MIQKISAALFLFGIILASAFVCSGKASEQQIAQAAATVAQVVGARVSLPGNGPHFWWTVATSSVDPEHVIACALRNSPSSAQGLQAVIYGSSDGGETWRLLKAVEGSEVSCATSHNDTVYFVMSEDSGRAPARMHFWRSDDFGKTWQPGPGAPYADSAKLVIEPGITPKQDRVFIFADSAYAKGRVVLRDGLTILQNGGTRIVQSAVPLPDISGHPDSRRWVSWASSAIRLDETTVGSLYLEPAPTSSDIISRRLLVFRRVTSNGHPIGEPIIVARLAPEFNRAEHTAAVNPRQQYAAMFFGIYRYPSIALSPIAGSAKKRVYVVWHDLVHGRLRICITSSDDNGITWTVPRAIDDSPLRYQPEGNPLPSAPSVAVNAQGIVAVTWAEFSGKCWRVALSQNGGQSFSNSMPINPCSRENVPLTDVLSGRLSTLPSSSGILLDDWGAFLSLAPGTSLAAAQDGSFYAAWTAYGTSDEGFHISRIIPPGVASSKDFERRKVIAAAICCLRTKSALPSVWIDYTALDYDAAMHQIIVSAVLVKNRKLGRIWPLVFRIRQIHSSLGEATIGNADNGVFSTGAAWVFDGPGEYTTGHAAPPNGLQGLTPSKYEFSKPRVLRFQIYDSATLNALPRNVWPSKNQLLEADGDILYTKNHL